MMKKSMRIPCALLALLTLLCAITGATAREAGLYTLDIASPEGWYPRGTDVTVAQTDEGLYVSGRTQSWHSPGRDFALTPGQAYRFTARVRQDEADSCLFVLSVALAKDGKETYVNLDTATGARGKWAELSATYTAGEYDRFTFYIETAGSPGRAFTLGAFAVESRQARYAGGLPILKDAYAPYFDIGCALTKNETYNAQRMAFCLEQFNIVTPGNELKPDSVLDVTACRKLAQAGDETAVAVRFDAAAPLLNFAQANGWKVHGHVLLWHNQTPGAFFHEGYDGSRPFVTREVMLSRMENYIAAVFAGVEERWPGLIISWDVVNEAVDDGTGKLRASNWTKVVGQDFVEHAFAFARKYAPAGVQLYYNDYSTPYDMKLKGVCSLLDTLCPQGNIDGYGFQAHYQLRQPSIAAIENAIQKIAQRGVRLRVSELDITISDDTEALFAAQGERYAELFRLFVKYADLIDAVQIWGVTDEQSWRASQYPLPFEEDYSPKPAFDGMIEAAGG